MKWKKRYLFILPGVLALLVCLACVFAQTNIPASKETGTMIDIGQQASRLEIATISAAHGEDNVISWADPGMEEHIRFLLDKPDGDILHSDVWDIHALCFVMSYSTPYDLAVGDEQEIYQEEDLFYAFEQHKKYEGQTFSPIESLEDLKYFDSLQVLILYFTEGESSTLSLAGLENCKNLGALWVQNTEPTSLASLSRLNSLENLKFVRCGEIDLSCLQETKNLSVLSLLNCTVSSLEPLADLPKLHYLSLEAEYFPPLEPLVGTLITHLSLQQTKSTGDFVDYGVLAQMSELIWLNLPGCEGFTVTQCNTILESCQNLHYLNITGTDAAKEVERLKNDRLTILVYRF